MCFSSVNPSSSQIDRSVMSTVQHTGSVYFSYQVILAVSCMLHFDVFPYDSQTFVILFGSLSYKRAALTISVPEGAAGVDIRLFEVTFETLFTRKYSCFFRLCFKTG